MHLICKHIFNPMNHQKVESIIRSVSASISIIGSAAIIWHILRSHKGLASTYHWLVFRLCVGDLMSSFAWALNSTAAPKEVQYLIPSARGNVATCAAQGCIVTAGITMATFYNCSICVYYLSVVTFNKKDEYIKRKLEPWFHGVPVISAIMIGIIGLIMKQYNTNYWVTNGIIPEGFTIPCGRGDTASGNLFKGWLWIARHQSHLSLLLAPSWPLCTEPCGRLNKRC